MTKTASFSVAGAAATRPPYYDCDYIGFDRLETIQLSHLRHASRGSRRRAARHHLLLGYD